MWTNDEALHIPSEQGFRCPIRSGMTGGKSGMTEGGKSGMTRAPGAARMKKTVGWRVL